MWWQNVEKQGLHCKREFWHHWSKGPQQEVNRAWDNQTSCRWRNNDSLGKENTSHGHSFAHHYFEYETISTNTGWSEHVAAMISALHGQERVFLQSREGMNCFISLFSYVFCYYIVIYMWWFSQGNWLIGLTFPIAFMMFFFCTELVEFVLLENRVYYYSFTICCILVFTIELGMGTVC